MKLSSYERWVLAITAGAALILFSVACVLDARSTLHLAVVRAERVK